VRIAGGIIGIFLALVILVQSLAAGTANAINEATGEKTDQGGSWGFLVALLFVIGSALLIGKVMKGAISVFAAAALFAAIGAASSEFSDLWVWMAVAANYAVAAFVAVRRRRRPSAEPVPG